MFRYGLDVALQVVRNILKRNSLGLLYCSENLYPPMIRYPLQMPLQLFRRLHPFILKHSHILENVRMFITPV